MIPRALLPLFPSLASPICRTAGKLCNHPGLLSETPRSRGAEGGLGASRAGKRVDAEDDGSDTDVEERLLAQADIASLIAASGKLIVLVEILRHWHTSGNRCLIFCQGRQFLSIIQAVVSARGYSYLRMDGTTAVRQRQALVDAFNADGGPFAFLLTTRVGGVGVNLIGADRVVIVDPDWVGGGWG